MKNISIAFFLLLVLPCFAQYKTVTYNDAKNWFNESQPLPAEDNWMLYGVLPVNAQMTTLEIYKTANTEKGLLYTSEWKMPLEAATGQFVMPVNFNLRGNDEYTFVISYFRKVTYNEKLKLQELLNDGIDAYISQSVSATNNNVSLRKHPKLIVQDLNQLIKDGIKLYNSANGVDFSGFSLLVLDKLKQIDELKLKKAKFNVIKQKEESKRNVKIEYFEKNITELKNLCKKELAQFLGSDLLVLSDRRVIPDYPTEKVKNILPINIGYAGVYDKGSVDNLSYGTSPYAGISFPLGNKAFSSKFWSNTSISAGVMFNKLDFEDDKNVSGPLIDRPIVVGLGYKTFYFLRLNAGTAILQTEKANGSDFSKVFLRPYVGLSIEINLWLGLER